MLKPLVTKSSNNNFSDPQSPNINQKIESRSSFGGITTNDDQGKKFCLKYNLT
jgi:hypothetical protein